LKTTIDVPPEIWKKFSEKVVRLYGNRKLNDVMVKLIELYGRDVLHVRLDDQDKAVLQEWKKARSK